jgi:tRNA(fMet)-specific endonuclease VapC
MLVLDTDTLSRFHAGDPRLQERRGQFGTAEVATTAVTRIEILQGRFDFILKAANGDELLRAFAWLARSEELLRQIPVLPIDSAVAARFDRLRQNRKLKKTGRADLLIAAIALVNDAIVVTRNVQHFRQVPGLRVENWFE